MNGTAWLHHTLDALHWFVLDSVCLSVSIGRVHRGAPGTLCNVRLGDMGVNDSDPGHLGFTRWLDGVQAQDKVHDERARCSRVVREDRRWISWAGVWPSALVRASTGQHSAGSPILLAMEGCIVLTESGLPRTNVRSLGILGSGSGRSTALLKQPLGPVNEQRMLASRILMRSKYLSRSSYVPSQ